MKTALLIFTAVIALAGCSDGSGTASGASSAGDASSPSDSSAPQDAGAEAGIFTFEGTYIIVSTSPEGCLDKPSLTFSASGEGQYTTGDLAEEGGSVIMNITYPSGSPDSCLASLEINLTDFQGEIDCTPCIVDTETAIVSIDCQINENEGCSIILEK